MKNPTKANQIQPCIAKDLIGETNELHYGDKRNPGNVYCYTPTLVDQGILNFADHFYLATGNPLSNPILKITLANILSLIPPPATGYDYTQHYSAVRIHYGLDGDTMIFIMQPIILKPVTGSGGYCDIDDIEDFYKVAAGQVWESISLAQKNQFTENYRNTIRIRHEEPADIFNDRFIMGHPADWVHADTRSCLIPLQQILRVYCENRNVPGDPDDGDLICFQIVANNYSTVTTNFKVHVVVHYNLPTVNLPTGTKIFSGRAADFAQMCPTNCTFTYVNNYGLLAASWTREFNKAHFLAAYETQNKIPKNTTKTKSSISKKTGQKMTAANKI